jgi:hypothetical protein
LRRQCPKLWLKLGRIRHTMMWFSHLTVWNEPNHKQISKEVLNSIRTIVFKKIYLEKILSWTWTKSGQLDRSWMSLCWWVWTKKTHGVAR